MNGLSDYDDDFYRTLGIERDPRFEMVRSWERRAAERKRQRRRGLLKWIAQIFLCFGVILLALWLRGRMLP